MLQISIAAVQVTMSHQSTVHSLVKQLQHPTLRGAAPFVNVTVYLHCLYLVSITAKHDVVHKNRKYMIYCNATKGGSRHRRTAKCTKIWRSLDTWFQRYACRQTDIHRDPQTDTHLLITVLQSPIRGGVINKRA